jgi:dihydroneopterin aldolase
MSRTLFFEALSLSVKIGTKAQERARPQTVLVSGECRMDAKERGNDLLAKTVDYDRLLRVIRSCAEPTEFSLLERLGDHIVDQILESFPGVDSITLRLWKEPAPLPFPVGRVGVTVSETRASWSGPTTLLP